jgi:hypothetical protein
MHHDYGYIRGTKGTDGDHVDVYIGPHGLEKAPSVFVVDQRKAPDFKTFDEQKFMLGFRSLEEARKGYLAHYPDNRFLGKIKSMPFSKFYKKVTNKGNHGKKIAALIDNPNDPLHTPPTERKNKRRAKLAAEMKLAGMVGRTATGAGMGAGIGSVLGYLATEKKEERAKNVLSGAGAGAVGGGLAGGFSGLLKNRVATQQISGKPGKSRHGALEKVLESIKKHPEIFAEKSAGVGTRMLVGAGAGAGLGGLIGYNTTKKKKNKKKRALENALFGAGMGAAIGGLSGSARKPPLASDPPFIIVKRHRIKMPRRVQIDLDIPPGLE